MKKTVVIFTFIMLSCYCAADYWSGIKWDELIWDNTNNSITWRWRAFNFIQPTKLSNRPIKSIKAELYSLRKESAKGTLYKELCRSYYRVNIDSALYYGNKAIRSAKDNNDRVLEAEAKEAMAVNLMSKYAYYSAVEYLYEAESIYTEQNNKVGLARVNNHLGCIFRELRNRELFNYLNKSEQIYKKMNMEYEAFMAKMNRLQYPWDYDNILTVINRRIAQKNKEDIPEELWLKKGTIFQMKQDTIVAYNCYKKSLFLADSSGNEYAKLLNYIALANIFVIAAEQSDLSIAKKIIPNNASILKQLIDSVVYYYEEALRIANNQGYLKEEIAINYLRHRILVVISQKKTPVYDVKIYKNYSPEIRIFNKSELFNFNRTILYFWQKVLTREINQLIEIQNIKYIEENNNKSIEDLKKSKEFLKYRPNTRWYDLYETEYIKDSRNSLFHYDRLLQREIQSVIELRNRIELLKRVQEIDKRNRFIFVSIAGSLVLSLVWYIIYRTKSKSHKTLQKQAKQITDANLELEALSKDLAQKNHEIEQTNLELAALNDTKTKLFSIISHDLKGPVYSFNNLSQFLSEYYYKFTDEEKKQHIDTLKISSGNVAKLLENLLSWARLQTENMRICTEKINISELLTKESELHTQAINDKNIKLQNTANQKINVFSDAETLNTVVRNLLSNAIKFTPEGGNIIITAMETKEFVEISIADTGIGIREEDKDKIFNVGIKHSTIGTNNEKGTGLGLNLCKEFLEKINGSIRFESELGKGTTFYVRLPKEESEII